jgi:hypothetical protein
MDTGYKLAMFTTLVILAILCDVFIAYGAASYKPKKWAYGLGFWGGVIIVILGFIKLSILDAVLLLAGVIIGAIVLDLLYLGVRMNKS